MRKTSIFSSKLGMLMMSMMLISSLTFAQRKITGKVMASESGAGLSGATVKVKGTSGGVTSGADGTYSIEVSSTAVSLEFSFVGYETQETKIGTGSVINVSLKVSANAMENVVVTGYSTQRKRDIIGAVSVIDVEDMKSTPSANLGAQLQGRATGVTVSGTGAPGSPAVVRIRGFQSIGNNEPLYVIDGVPTSDPSIINPQDVESIQILKDGTAAAIYGTRGANGVVIITTKQGKAGRSVISYETYIGSQDVTNSMRPDMLSTPEYIQYLTKSGSGAHPVFGQPGSFKNPDYIILSNAYKGGVSSGDPKANPALYSLSPLYQILQTSPNGTNWFDEILQSSKMQSHQISASGGNDRATYSIGLNYFNQDGTFKLTKFDRFTLRSNSTLKATNWLRFGENMQVSYQNTRGGQQRGEGGAWSWAYRMVPYIPVFDIKGGFGGNGVGASGNGSNPIANLMRDQDDKNITIRIFGNVFAEVQPVKWLTFKTSLGADVGNNYTKDISRKTYERSENQGTTQLTEYLTQFTDWTLTNTATFQKSFGDHDVKLLVGSEAIKRSGKQISAFGQNFDLDNADFISLGNAGTAAGDRNVNQIYDRTTTITSEFGRLDYAYVGKYLLNGTLRRDGASVFGPDSRFGIFPSVGLGWRVSSEKFMENVSWIKDMKLRGGYGTVGSISNVDPFNSYSTFRTGPGFGNYDLGGSNTSALLGYRLNTVGNPGTKWETTVSKNIGMDLSILDGRWNFDVNLFQNDTRDLLYRRPNPPTGPLATQPYDNIGTMRNKGYELSVSNNGKLGGELRYDVQLNFSHYKNTLIKLNNEGVPLYIGMDRFSSAVKNDAGLPISSFWGYQIIGFYKNQAEVDAGPKLAGSAAKVGTWKYLDRDKDGNINSNDMGQIGSPHPKFQMGLNIGLTYKQFDFNTFLFWNYGNSIYNYTKWYTDMRGFVGGVSSRVLYNTWKSGDGDDVSKLPILQNANTENGFVVPGGYVTGASNSYYVESGSFLRAKTMQLGYNVPEGVSSKLKLQKVRMYLQAQNLFTITKYNGADPDLNIVPRQGNPGGVSDGAIGIDQSGFPNPRQILFGLNVTF